MQCMQVSLLVTLPQLPTAASRSSLSVDKGAPGIVLGELGSAAALGALECIKLVAAAAALAEALPDARPQEAWRLDVNVANAALLVVGAQSRQITHAAFHL